MDAPLNDDFGNRVPPGILNNLTDRRLGPALGTTALQWAIISTVVYCAAYLDLWFVDILAAIIIASRQHALLVLMHDASHGLLAKKRWLNDLISNLFLSFPLMLSTERYRAHHLQHHRFLNTDGDPDLPDARAPLSARVFLGGLVLDLTGIGTLRTFRSLRRLGVMGAESVGWRKGLATRESITLLLFSIVAAAGITYFAAWGLVLRYWIAPLVFVLPPILRIRALAEHGSSTTYTVAQSTRTIEIDWLERILFSPCNVNLHLEHHWFPSVPFYNLPTLSNYLRAQAGDAIVVTRGYFWRRGCLLEELYGGVKRPS